MKENRIDISYGNRLNEQIAKVKKMKKQPPIDAWSKIEIGKRAIASVYKESPDYLLYRKMTGDGGVVLARMTNKSSTKNVAYKVNMDIKITPIIEDSTNISFWGYKDEKRTWLYSDAYCSRNDSDNYDCGLLGGVCVMKKFDWNSFLNYFGNIFFIIIVSIAIGVIICATVVSSFMRLLFSLVIFCGSLAYILTKHDEKSQIH